MIARNAKTVLFASLVAAMILPFSIMGMVNATPNENAGEKANERIDTKKQNIKNLGDKMDTLFMQISDLEDSLESETDEKEKTKIQKSLNASYDEIDKMQERAYKLFEIPEKRYQKLLEAKQEIINQYQDTGMLDDIFIDHSDESIQVILHSNYFDSHKDSVKNNADSIAASKRSDTLASADGDIGKIEVGIKHVTNSAVASDLICAQLHSIFRGYTYQCTQATIGFPATRDSNNDRGFVTVGHAFTHALSSSVGPASTNIQVFQPGPDANNVDGRAQTSGAGEPLSNYFWQRQLIGKLTYGVYTSGTVHDSAFVKLESGKTVDAEVKLWRDREYSITSYESTSSQSVGGYVYQSGAATGYTSGYIVSTGNARGTYADYNECRGDSGAPVGQYSSGFKVFGMHIGIADDDPSTRADAQTAPCATRGDGYSIYVPYDTISEDLGITGTTS